MISDGEMSERQDIEFLNLRESNRMVEDALTAAAESVIRSGRYLGGEQTAAFEKELAISCGTAHTVGVSNGLDAIRLILRAYIELGRIRPGDGILIPANTYIASVLPATEFGLRPVLAEPDPATFGIDWQKALEILDSGKAGKISALMTVHLYGNPSWDSRIAAEMRSRGLLIIEDNAQAIGAAVEDSTDSDDNPVWRPTGGLGDAAAFSFYPTKNIGALGDAGAVACCDPELAATVRALANYGSDRRYHNIYRGYNCRLDEIQAAFLRVQLSRLEAIGRERRVMAAAYSRSISHPDVILPRKLPATRQVWHQYPILSPRRDELRNWLATNGIATDIHYAVPPHLQPCYKDLPHGPLPLTEKISNEIISLPIANADMSVVERVAEAINSFPLT